MNTCIYIYIHRNDEERRDRRTVEILSDYRITITIDKKLKLIKQDKD